MTKLTTYLLTNQAAIDGLSRGQLPNGKSIIIRDFATAPQVDAYARGVDMAQEEHLSEQQIDELNYYGSKVMYVRPSDDADEEADVVEVFLSSEDEAKACHAGISDAIEHKISLAIIPGDDEHAMLSRLLSQPAPAPRKGPRP